MDITVIGENSISPSWVIRLDGGSVVRVFASAKQLTVEVAVKGDDPRVAKWVEKHPGSVTRFKDGSLKTHLAKADQLISWLANAS